EKSGITDDNLRAFLLERLRNDGITEVMWNRAHSMVMKTFGDEIVSLAAIGFLGRDERGFLKLTNDGIRALQSNYHNNQYAAEYFNYRTYNVQVEATNNAKKSAKWAMLAAVAALTGVLVQTVLIIIERLCS